MNFPGSVDGPWTQYVHEPDERGIGTVRYPRLVPKDDKTAELLAKRTLTNLYNERPTWLDLAHGKLDEAVFAAYGWETPLRRSRRLNHRCGTLRGLARSSAYDPEPRGLAVVAANQPISASIPALPLLRLPSEP